MSDLAIQGNELLYTDGGVDDNYTIDGCSVIASNGVNLFANDPNSNGIIHIGKQFTPTNGLTFFAGITALLPTADGPITNMIYMDATLVIFKQRSIYTITRTGTNRQWIE